MSLTFIAMIGILVGFLCLAIGFYMGDAKENTSVGVVKANGAKTMRKKIIVPRRKAA